MRKNGIDGITFDGVVALGANLSSEFGPPQKTLERALESLEDRGFEIVGQSGWYNTPAWPAGSGPDYVNGAALVRFARGPHAALAEMRKIETALGRVRAVDGRWQPRSCDLDLLCWGDVLWPDAERWAAVAEAPAEAERPELVLPHPRLQERAFVLVPMAEIAPHWLHPALSQTAEQLRSALPASDLAAVRRVEARVAPLAALPI